MAANGDEHVSLTSLQEEMTEECEDKEGEEEDDMDEGEKQDSESSEDDDDELEDSAVDELEAQVASSPYEYSCHIELIKLLRKVGELDKLRRANQRMSELFPLTAELWLDWIKDEVGLISTQDDREKIIELFERAVMDYVAPGVWLEYGQFCISGIGTPQGVEKARSVFERSLTSVGLHVARGNEVWEVYREFENVLLRNLQVQQGASATGKDEKIAKQTERVSAIFRRQLSVPLMDMEETYKEYENWLEESPSQNVQQAYDKALAKLKKCYTYEKQLLQAESQNYDIYKAYLEHERTDGNPARIQCLYERALTDNCLQIELWRDYTKYLDSELKIRDVVLPVYTRAVRNCPWSVDLWVGYLVALERYGELHGTVTETFEKALNAGFSSAPEYLQLWQIHIDYLRRRIDWNSDYELELTELRSELERAGEHLATYFGVEGDPTCSLQQYLARMEAKYCKNMETARSQWNEIMSLGHANEAQMWLEYFHLERSYGDSKHCRKILHRAIAAVSDYPECLFEALINFEREEGTLETWENALKRIETQTVRVNEMRAKAAKDDQNAVQETKTKTVPAKAKAKKMQDKKKPEQNSKAVKRKMQDEKPLSAEDSQKSQGDSDIFKMPLPPPLPSGAAISSVKSAGGESIPLHPAKKAKVDDSMLQPQPGVRWGPPPKEKPTHDTSNDHLTIFVKNLSYELTEKQIRNVFSQCGEIEEIRMVENYRHQFRGYCYIEFKDSVSVDKALKMDRQSVEGRPMFVDRCVDKATSETKKAFQYETKMEKNKLFLSGLPRSATAEQLERVFSRYGKVSSVRIVTYRSGVPKGLAYVDFEQESNAARAVVGADNTVMDGHTISVAISNPPARKPKKEESGNQTTETQYPPKSLGSKGVVGPRGKGRTQLSLVPRAVQRTTIPSTSSGQEEPKEQPESATKGRMSNADFAKMLLK